MITTIRRGVVVANADHVDIGVQKGHRENEVVRVLKDLR